MEKSWPKNFRTAELLSMPVHASDQPPTVHRPLPSDATSETVIIAPMATSTLGRSRFAWPALFVLLGFVAIPLDVPLTRWFLETDFPGDVKKLFDLAEIFGHGTGAALILLSAWVLLPQRRSALARVIACTYLAGLGANICKLLLARRRPNWAELDAGVWETFGRWLPFTAGGSTWQGFPSAHTALATGLAMGLTWLVPRGKWLFTFFVVLVALQRIASGYHFLSDTFWGAAVGWVVAAACLPGGLFSRPFEKVEYKVRSQV